jgi:methylmalonyl-CoA mutase N-terminal domain/subunit
MDEALALPSQKAATVALRTQQIIAHESGVTNTIDPLGGSYFVEKLTDDMEAEVYRYFRRIDDLGGVLPAIQKAFFQQEIADAAFVYQREIDEHRRTIVGVNDYVDAGQLEIPILEMDPQGYDRQVARLHKLRQERDNETVGTRLNALRQAARGTENVMPYILGAVRAYATLQEIMDVFRDEFGLYQEESVI